jgi:hypothetical protein
MADAVGYLTQIRTVTWREMPSFQWVRMTETRVMWLHPTKGWRSCERKKKTEKISGRDAFPRTTFKETWRSA